MRNKRHFLYCVFFWTLCLASWGRGAHVVTKRPHYAFSLDKPFAELKGQESEGAKLHHAGNYAIEGIACEEARCPVRIIVKSTDKLGGSLVDVEIGGRRTMISYRGGLETGIIRLVPQNALVENVCLAPLQSAEN